MTATGRTQVKWAVGGPQFAPELAHFQGELNGRELEMVFDGSTSADGPHNGRGISKTKVGDLLAQVPDLESLESLGIARSRDDKGTRTFAELRVGPGDEGLKGKTALRWLVDSESNFSPGMIATGKSVVAPSSLPKKTMYGKPENSAAPTYANCVGALCRVLKLLDDDRNDPAFQKLHTLFYCLPSLLLRVPKDVPHRKKTKIIESNCERFLRGKWKSLFMEAAKACSVQPRGFLAPGGPAEAPLIDEDGVNRAGMADKARRAEEKAKGGNYSAARRHLCGPGLGTGPDLFQEMQNKFPKAEPPTWPAVEPEIEITDDCFGECLEEELQKALSLDGMIKVARAAPRMAGCDQWGMDLRGIIYPLLLSEGVGSDVYNFFIMARREGYLPPLYAEYYRGGRLIPLSKFPKEGARPITVGDAIRRLFERAHAKVEKKAMARYFEETYANVKQFAGGTASGAEIMHNVLQMLAQGEVAPSPPPADDDLPDDPFVVVNLDLKNAFNEVQRQVIIDLISGEFGDRTYDQGNIGSHNKPPPVPNEFKGHFQSFKAHYTGTARLAMIDPNGGQTRIVWCTKGVQQGDVLGGPMFNLAIHAIVGSCLKRHRDVFAALLADNGGLAGRCSKVFPAVKDLVISLKEIGLVLNPRDSGMYAPTHHAALEPPTAYTDAMNVPDMPDIPWVGTGKGLVIVGFPMGPEAFTRDHLVKIRDDIRRELGCMRYLEDGLVYHHMLRLCISTRFIYHMRGLDPSFTAGIAEEIDQLMWQRWKDYYFEVQRVEWDADEEDAQLQQAKAAEDARVQFHMCLARGGLGINPNAAIVQAGFYSGVAVSLRMAARFAEHYAPLKEAIDSATFRDSSFHRAFAQSRDFLLACTNAVTSTQDAELRAEEEANPPAQGQKPPQRYVIPDFGQLYRRKPALDEDPLVPIPDQRRLTSLARTHPDDPFRRELASQYAQERMDQLCPSRVMVTAPDAEDSVYKNYGVDRKKESRYLPLAMFGSTAAVPFVAITRFVMAAFLATVLDLENTVHPDDKCKCGQRDPDMPNEHDLTCKHWAAFTNGHQQIVYALERLGIAAGFPVAIGPRVPTLKPSDKCGDVHTKLAVQQRSEVHDVTIVHVGGSELWRDGQAAITRAMNTKHNAKVNRYRQPYSAMGHNFTSFVVTTHGQIHPEAQRTLYFIALRMTQQHMHYYYTDLKFDVIMARNIERVNAVASAAIASGVGLRARGIRGGRIGVDPPRRGWRTQDDIVGGIEGPVDYSHMMADDWFGGN